MLDFESKAIGTDKRISRDVFFDFSIMISRGNVSEKIYIPPLGKVIGGPEIDLHLKATHDAREPFLFDPTIFFGSYSKMGMNGFRAAYES